jgi:aminopeptidase N
MDWIIGNIKHSGFYRVNYDSENWNLLINQLNDINGFQMIDVISRAQLLDDSFNLGKSEIIDQTIFLKLASYLKFETDSLAFQAANDGFNFIENMLSNNYSVFKIFKVYDFINFFRSLILFYFLIGI